MSGKPFLIDVDSDESIGNLSDSLQVGVKYFYFLF